MFSIEWWWYNTSKRQYWEELKVGSNQSILSAIETIRAQNYLYNDASLPVILGVGVTPSQQYKSSGQWSKWYTWCFMITLQKIAR